MFIFFFITFPYLAEAFAPLKAEGHYESEAGSVDVIILDKVGGDVAIKTVIVQGACSGSVAGISKFSNQQIVFSPFIKEDGDKDKCKLTASFTKDHAEVSVNAEDCGSYSGASCGWEGQKFKKDRSPSK